MNNRTIFQSWRLTSLPRGLVSLFGLLALVTASVFSFIAPGYQTAVAAAATKMYWTDLAGSVKRADVDGTNIETIATGLSGASGIAIDAVNGKVYWTAWDANYIQRANLDGTSPEVLVDASDGVQYDRANVIALDVPGGKMYWTDWDDADIYRANLDGSNIEALVTTGINPEGIALDLTSGKMYWGNRFSLGIMRANLDGTSIETVVSSTNDVRQVQLDVAGGKIYWADVGGTGKLQRANLNGSSVENLITGLGFDIWGIDLDLTAGKIYISYIGQDKIGRANLDGTGQEFLISGLTNPAFIALLATDAVQPGPVFTVNVTNDNSGDCTEEDCSLREAITAANAHPNGVDPDEIHFNIPGAGVHTITPLSALPSLSNPVIIDGTTQPGASCAAWPPTLLIELNGTSIASFSAFDISPFSGDGSTIRGLVINRFGIAVHGAHTSNNTLTCNFIGTNADGSAALPNTIAGIWFQQDSNNNFIGGPAVSDRNLISGNPEQVSIINFGSGPSSNVIQNNFIGTDVAGTTALGGGSYAAVYVFGSDDTRVLDNVISGNDGRGVEISGDGTRPDLNSVIQGNIIGLDASGAAALPNGGPGIIVRETASGTLIGGPDEGQDNVISGNVGDGVYLYNTSNHTIQGNRIGTNAAGTSAIPNGGYGVLLSTTDNVILGGSNPGEGNLISGNTYSGIFITGATVDGNLVRGNYIGTNGAGTAALPNGDGDDMGIYVSNTPNTQIIDNLVSGNNGEGIGLWEAGTIYTVIQGNRIGVQADGVSPLGNTSVVPYYGSGIAIRNDASNTTIGGTGEPEYGNIIAYNGLAGVVAYSGTGNEIRGNAIYANGGLGIDLADGDLGATPNDVNDFDSGPNELQNFPVLLEVDPGEGTSITGRLNATPSASYTLDFYSVDACDTSGFGEGEIWLGSTVVNTDATGDAEFSDSVSTISSNDFLVATATDGAGNTSEFSQCAAPGQENTSWTRALRIHLTEINPGVLNGTADQYIDQFGQSRWFKFAVQPGSQAIITLSNLPANYDLTLYKDIGATFESVTSPTPDDLVKLGAEFAPDAFSPDAFSPDAFSPDAFSPDAFSPDAFSPDAFSPDAFSPDAFSPDAFSPDAFSPDAFSPDAFSPDAFSPDAFSPDAFSPDAFSSDPDAYTSAQTRSLLAVSAFEGTASEGVSVFTWNNTGDFYIRVRGRDGVFSLASKFHVDVTLLTEGCSGVTTDLPATSLSATAGGYKTLILTDFNRMDETQAGNSTADKAALLAQLTALAARPEVDGVIVDVGADARVAAANTQADANFDCPFAKNLVVEAIANIITNYRAVNPVEYVVVVGSDNVIPFYRYPDQSMLANEQNYAPPVRDATASQASLKLGYFLTQDIYGSSQSISVKTNQLPIPDVPVGRLVETAVEATTVVNAYLGTAGGVVPTPTTALVTGYDFLEDAALAVQTELEAGLGQNITTLIAPRDLSPLDPTAWTADNLRALLLGSRHDLIYLAGHFSANSALAADYSTRLLASEVAASSVNLTNAVIFSAGCHSGYSIVNEHGIPNVTLEPDWARAFAQKGALLIAGTGYQYGDTDFIEYSERLYLEFSHQLRVGNGPVAVGQALVAAKQQYLSTTPELQGIHEKALLEATLYGLPMLSVNLPAGRVTSDGDPSIVDGTTPFTTNPGQTFGLEYANVTILPNLTPHEVTLETVNTGDPVIATYLSGSNGVVVNPAEPVLPLEIRNVSVAGTVLRGVGFIGALYSDTPNILPLIGAATTELRGVHAPFLSSVHYPIRPWNVNYYGALIDDNGATQLMLTPAQYISDEAHSLKSILRAFSNVQFRLFYNNNVESYSGNIPALAAPPTINNIEAEAIETEGGGEARFKSLTALDTAIFSLRVTGDPSAGIQEVWVTFSATSGPFAGKWQSLYLTQHPLDTTLWEGELDLQGTPPEDFYFIAQAVNGVGLVSMVTNEGAFYKLIQPQQGSPAPTSLALNSPASQGVFGNQVTLNATLTSDGNPLAGRTVLFTLGAQSKSATTNGSGQVSATFTLQSLPGNHTLQATFAGNADYAPSSDSNPFTILKQNTVITLDPVNASGAPGQAGLMMLTLKDAANHGLAQKTLFVIISGVGGTTAQALITDFAGRATLEAVNLPVGAYDLDAYFSGNVPLPGGALALTDSRYNSSTADGALTLSLNTNTAPVATGDSYTTTADVVLNVAAPGVLTNDTDTDLDQLTALLVSGPAHGALTLRLDGSFVYTPTLHYHGPDAFRYKAHDGDLDSNTVTVTLTVNNTPPVAVGNAYTTTENVTLNVTAPGVLANDTDPQLDPLTAILVSGSTHGALNLRSNGSFVYTPTVNFDGQDAFTYKANDGSLNSNVVTVTITVSPMGDDLVYGVQDQDTDDSQFFTLDPETHAIAPLGPIHYGADIEGLDIHPITGELYGASGQNNTHGKVGWLFKVNRQTGALTPIGYTGGRKGVPALSFRADGTLWGWAKGKGLVTINLTTGKATVVYAASYDVFGLAWDNAGQKLYLARGRNLYVYDPVTRKMKFFSNNLPGHKIEMLEFRPDGLLQVGADGSKTLFAYNVATKRLAPSGNILTPYDDVEGLAWPASQGGS